MDTKETTENILSGLDQAADKTLKRTSRIVDKIKVSLERKHQEMKNFQEESEKAADAHTISHIYEKLNNGELPDFFIDLVEEALGFDVFSYCKNKDLKILNKHQNSLLVSIPEAKIIVRIETYNVHGSHADSKPMLQSPQFKRCISHISECIAQPVGNSKKNLFLDHEIHCSVYKQNNFFPDDENSYSENDIEKFLDSRVINTLFVFHHTPLKKHLEENCSSPTDNELIDAHTEILDRLREAIITATDDYTLEALKGAQKSIEKIIEDSEEKNNSTVILMDSLDSAVFREFAGKIVNVDTFYTGSPILDLGYIAYLTGIDQNEDSVNSSIREMLYFYKLVNSIQNTESIEQMIEDVLSAANIFRVLRNVGC